MTIEEKVKKLEKDMKDVTLILELLTASLSNLSKAVEQLQIDVKEAKLAKV